MCKIWLFSPQSRKVAQHFHCCPFPEDSFHLAFASSVLVVYSFYCKISKQCILNLEFLLSKFPLFTCVQCCRLRLQSAFVDFRLFPLNQSTSVLMHVRYLDYKELMKILSNQ